MYFFLFIEMVLGMTLCDDFKHQHYILVLLVNKHNNDIFSLPYFIALINPVAGIY